MKYSTMTANTITWDYVRYKILSDSEVLLNRNQKDNFERKLV
jgi:hypothetical protein